MTLVTLTDFFNMSNLEARKRKKEAQTSADPPKDEIFFSVKNEIEGGKARPKVKFERPGKI